MIIQYICPVPSCFECRVFGGFGIVEIHKLTINPDEAPAARPRELGKIQFVE